VLLLALPDQPETARWLSVAERDWLRGALTAETAATGDHGHNLLRALTNRYVLLLGMANACNYIAINAIIFSAPKLLAHDTGFDVAGVGRIVSAGGVGIALGLLLVGSVAGQTVGRTLVAYVGLVALAAAGLVLLWLGGTGETSIGGYIVFIAASQIAGMLPLAVVSRLIPAADRAGGLAMANTISQGGAFVGPILWGVLADRTGSYHTGVALLIPMMAGAAAFALAVRARSLQAG
jgi:ACS family tartrate transporter-like MFS transporter